MKVWNRIINIICYIILAMMICGMILFLAGFRPYVVLSGSMEPEIHVGSMAVVNENTTYDEIKTGDIVAFRSRNGALVTHRVVSITADGFETQGDANDITDGPLVTQDNYRGKTIFAVPCVGYLMFYLKKPWVLMPVVTAMVVILLTSVDQSKKTKKSENRIEEKCG